VVTKQKITNPRPNSAGSRKLALGLSASPDEGPAGTVIDELPSAVLDVAHAWAKRPARSSDCGAGNAANNRTDGTSNNRTRDNAGCCSCALLRRLAGSGSEADQGCKDELAHGASPLLPIEAPRELNGLARNRFSFALEASGNISPHYAVGFES
jgi:hypothetical protein